MLYRFTPLYVYLYLYFLVDCEWDMFGNWSQCDKICGGGSKFRTRDIKVATDCGGQTCEGNTQEQQSCNTQPCPGTT